ncbi:hypothetical protein BJP62_17775 [Jeongeupia sp. USM3]|nr:hypothetical protein [Jeongeupia sp. USM3]AOY02124.1 hypothetical protein BJP62_17775 [Jeongeupia sp. USM3]
MLSLKQPMMSLAVVSALSMGSAFAATAYSTNGTNVSPTNVEGVVKNSIGECWRTGTWSKEQATVEGCDGYVKPQAVAATPAPVAPAPAPVVKSKTFSLQADVLFDFNKASLKPAGKDALDKLYADVVNFDPKAKPLSLATPTASVRTSTTTRCRNVAPSRSSTTSSARVPRPTRSAPKAAARLTR